MNKLDLIGQKFSRLLVIEKAEHHSKRTAWKCQCYCGTIKVIKTEELRSGDTKSCGCWNDEQRSARAKNMYSKNIKFLPHITTARKVWKTRYSDISFDDFYELSQQNCYYCGVAPNNLQNAPLCDKKSSLTARENGDFIYNGLDRMDNTLGHTKENCVPCCKYCNYAKREQTQEEFKLWLVRIYKHFIE